MSPRNTPAPPAEDTGTPTPDAATDGSPLATTDRAELAKRLNLLTEDERTDALTKLTEDGRKLVESITPAELATAASVLSIEGFSQASTETPTEFRTATTPIRARNALQEAMDRVAVKAYADWVKAGRPTQWQKMPVITYFKSPEEVAEYTKLINKAVALVEPIPYQKDGKDFTPTGVRARIGHTFVLSERMAAQINKPEEAGKTVLAWAAIDKRAKSNGN